MKYKYVSLHITHYSSVSKLTFYLVLFIIIFNLADFIRTRIKKTYKLNGDLDSLNRVKYDIKS